MGSERLQTIRSKLIAHKESSVGEADLYEKHAIKPNDIKFLLDTMAEHLRELEKNLTGEPSFHTTGKTNRWEQATYNVLESLRISGHHKDKEQF